MNGENDNDIVPTYPLHALGLLKIKLEPLGRRAEAAELDVIRGTHDFPFVAAHRRWGDLLKKITGL